MRGEKEACLYVGQWMRRAFVEGDTMTLFFSPCTLQALSVERSIG